MTTAMVKDQKHVQLQHQPKGIQGIFYPQKSVVEFYRKTYGQRSKECTIAASTQGGFQGFSTHRNR